MLAAMGFQFRRRISLGNGFGLNASGSGLSMSKRTSFGSIGTRGASFRTGIPGLSYRVRWGKKGAGAVAGLAVNLFILAIGLSLFALYWGAVALYWLAVIGFQVTAWIVLTIYDLIVHLSRPKEA